MTAVTGAANAQPAVTIKPVGGDATPATQNKATEPAKDAAKVSPGVARGADAAALQSLNISKVTQ